MLGNKRRPARQRLDISLVERESPCRWTGIQQTDSFAVRLVDRIAIIEEVNSLPEEDVEGPVVCLVGCSEEGNILCCKKVAEVLDKFGDGEEGRCC